MGNEITRLSERAKGKRKRNVSGSMREKCRKGKKKSRDNKSNKEEHDDKRVSNAKRRNVWTARLRKRQRTFRPVRESIDTRVFGEELRPYTQKRKGYQKSWSRIR